METFSALLAICAENSPVPGEFPAQRPVTRSFDVFFDLPPNKRLSKYWRGWRFETPSIPLWRHCNVNETHELLFAMYNNNSYSAQEFSSFITSYSVYFRLKQTENLSIIVPYLSCKRWYPSNLLKFIPRVCLNYRENAIPGCASQDGLVTCGAFQKRVWALKSKSS